MSSEKRINIDEPRYDQTTYIGRVKHFFFTTNPLNIFASSDKLEKAKTLVQQYREGTEPKGTTEDEIWKAKNLYDSAFHPDTGEKMILVGRMSAQVPMNMSIIGCMMTFYKSTGAIVFWQWFNQTFNAIVNYTNRSGDQPIPNKILIMSYVAATGGALTSALLLNKAVMKMPPLIGRFVPFVAVATANSINLPCMRSQELKRGIPVFTEDGEKIGKSTKAAFKAIAQVTISRVIMASPGMIFPPFFMQKLDNTILKKYPKLACPIQVLMVGFCITFTTPLCCALFPQKSSIARAKLEPSLRDKLDPSIERVYYNKGL